MDELPFLSVFLVVFFFGPVLRANKKSNQNWNEPDWSKTYNTEHIKRFGRHYQYDYKTIFNGCNKRPWTLPRLMEQSPEKKKVFGKKILPG